MSLPRLLAFIAAAVLLLSCTSKEYAVGLLNLSGKEIRDANASWDGFSSGGGVLTPNMQKVHMAVSEPLPATALVEWRTPDNVLHREAVDLTQSVPDSFEGFLYFEILPDDSVRVVPRADVYVPPIRVPAATDVAFVERFLRVWMVERDLDRSANFFHPNFHVPSDEDSPWPTHLLPMPLEERVLRFPSMCHGAKADCPNTPACIRPVEKSSAAGRAFNYEILDVNEQMIAGNSSLRTLKGQQLVHVSFVQEGCNIGTSILLVPNATSDKRVLSIFYIAG